MPKKLTDLIDLGIDQIPLEFQAGNLHPCQKTIFDSPARIRIAICGRRFGKSHLGLAEILRACVESQKRVAWWISAEETQSLRASRKLQLPLREQEVADAITQESTRQRLILKNGSLVEFLSAGSGDHLRGEGLDFLVLDEAADVPEEVWSTVLRPALIDKPGRALILGTPRRRCDWLHKLYTRGLDPTQHKDIQSFHFKSSDNKKIDEKQILFAKELMTPEEARRELDAEFVDLSPRTFGDVRVLATGTLQEAGEKGQRFVTGIDLARHHDYTVLVSLLVPDNPNLAKPTLCGFRRFTDIPWEQQIALIRGHLQQFPGVAYMDSTGLGSTIYERMQPHQSEFYPFTISGQSKPKLIHELQTGLQLKELLLAPEETLLRELEAFEVIESREPGHATRYEAPRGGHDDTVIALALAWHGYVTHHGRALMLDAGAAVDALLPAERKGFFA